MSFDASTIGDLENSCGEPIGLQFLQGQYQTDYGALMAMTLVSVIPLVILFLAFQRFFVQGLATTGLR